MPIKRILLVLSLLCLFLPLPRVNAVIVEYINASETIPQKVNPGDPLPVILSGNAASNTVTLATGNNTIGSVTVITLPSTPTGTNTIGSVAVTVLPSIPEGTNTIGSVTVIALPTVTISSVTAPLAIDPTANSTGSATGNPTTPFGAMLYLTDNSTLQRWFTAIVQGDGVNGNNLAGVGGWVWNGTTWDRQRQNALLLPPLASTVAALGGYTINTPETGFHVSLSVQTPGAECWYIVGSTTPVVQGVGHHPMTFWSDFDCASMTSVSVISSTAASITYQIDRR